MKAFAVALAGLVACAERRGADEKLDLTGKYTLVSAKKNGANLDDAAKKAKYTITADQFTITGGDVKFVISYKVTPGRHEGVLRGIIGQQFDPQPMPMTIDMSFVEGPDGTKGLTAMGIVELKGDTLKLAYTLGKADKRPKNFDGTNDFLIELKKTKE